jgi:hypothetical protein
VNRLTWDVEEKAGYFLRETAETAVFGSIDALRQVYLRTTTLCPLD